MGDWGPLVVSLLALAGALWSVTRTAPARLSKQVAECVDLVGTLEAAWRKERAATIEWLEEAQGVLESVERKRRQVSGAASRLNAANGTGEPDLTNATPEQIRDHYTRVARARGLLS